MEVGERFNFSIVRREMLSEVTDPQISKGITALIPAHNEARRIAEVIEAAKHHVDEVLVVDDSSSDSTSRVAEGAGARVVRIEKKKGYIESIKTGFREANGDIIVTLDADGEHDPSEVPFLIRPILEGRADLVLGRRKKIARISERLISFVTKLNTGVTDSGTGFRAMKKELALKLNLRGRCICGISVLEAKHLGARITEIPITIRNIDRKRRIAWEHLFQIFYILKWMV